MTCNADLYHLDCSLYHNEFCTKSRGILMLEVPYNGSLIKINQYACVQSVSLFMVSIHKA